MTTVTAKQLREHLSEYLDRMEAGEEIAIIRHSEIIGNLQPAHAAGKGNGPAILAAIEAFHNSLGKDHPLFKTDPNKSAKELYHDALASDPKYARYLTKPKR